MLLDFVSTGSEGPIIEMDDVADELAYWEFTLVGTVLGKRVTKAQLEGLVHKNWNHVTAPDILYFSRGWFYFRFANLEDMNSIIQGNSWNVNGFPLIFKKWAPNISSQLDDITTVPVWVLFPGLDPYFWSPKALSKLASQIGKPICADDHTTNKTRVAFARVQIEVDVSSQLPRAITFKSPFGDTLTQRVDYEWVPYYCSVCKKLGHQDKVCKKRKPAVTYRVKVTGVTSVTDTGEVGPVPQQVSLPPPFPDMVTANSIPGVGSDVVSLVTTPTTVLESAGFKGPKTKTNSGFKAPLPLLNLGNTFASLADILDDPAAPTDPGGGSFSNAVPCS
ncbi:hypothetical protein vseg_008050 [Gypsophila vaccaria]